MSQYSSGLSSVIKNELSSIIKQLRKISANTCVETEQAAYYEKEVCGTLPDVEGQTSQYTLIRVYTRDTDTGQIVLSHYEDTLGNIISGTVVEACCDSAVCGSPYSCAANIVGLSVDMEGGGILLDITGTTMTGYLQWMIDGVVQDTFPNPGINTLLIDIANEITTGGITISLLVGNNVDMDMYCMFSFETLADLNADLKEVGENPNWNPFPALTAGLGCTGTLTYTLIIDATENGVTVDYTTGELTLPAGIYDSYAFVEVRCDGVLVAVAGLQLLNVVTCDINISSLTMDAENVVIHTEGTTAGGYISITTGLGEYPIPPLANPVSEQFPPLGLLDTITFDGDTLEINIYRDAAGNDLCDTITVDIFAQTGITIPEVGSPTLFNTPAVFALPACAGTLSYTELFEGDSGDIIVASVDSVTGVVTIPAQTLPSGTGRYYYYVTCTVLGVPTVIATCYLEVTQEEPVPQLGFKLTWDNIVNSPFATHTDLNTFINGNGGAANYTSVVTVGNVQTFIGGTAVSLGSNFMNANPSIISITDETSHVVGQLSGGQSKCPILALIDFPALASQVSNCQSGNILLATLKLPSLTTQGTACQSSNDTLLSISLPSLTTQINSNQSNNTLLTAITLPLLTTQVGAKKAGNQSSNPALLSLLLPSLTTQATENQRSNAVLPTISLPALTTQTNDNQTNNAALTTISLPNLTTQAGGNQSNNALLTLVSLPNLATQGTSNQTSNASIVTLTLPALTTQSSLNQNTNALMTSLSLPVLATQDDENQSHNASLVTLTLPALTAQVSTNQNDNTLLTSITANLLTIQNNGNQSNNPALTTFTANTLATQINGNQTNNTLLTTITTPALTSIGTGNYVGCTYNIMTINVDASLFGAADILLAQAGGATII